VDIRAFDVGGDRNLAYLVVDPTTRQAAVIDPSYAPERIVRYAVGNDVSIRYGLCTHGHVDHTNGNDSFQRLTGIRPLLFGDRDPTTGTRVEHNAVLPLGNLTIRILYTPGHSQDSICLAIGDAVFTGDTLFVGKVGGTDFADGAHTEYRSIHDHLLTLPPETRVFPGHDVGIARESTIARERDTNPFLLQPSIEAFIDLKRNWAAYKKEHGIA